MVIRWSYLKRVLAGAIFGLYMANLLYFLNPQIDITPGRLALVTIVYGLTCGLLFGSALWLLRLIRVWIFGTSQEEGTYRAHGFGFVVLAAFVATAIYWIHLTAFQIYLPRGAVRILGKATNLITGTAFALLFIWVAERNARLRTSRILFLSGVALIAITSFFLYERRDSYRTEKREAVVASIGTVAGERAVIVVAIRNLPYDWIVTLAGEGTVPFLEQARKRSYFTRLEPFTTTSPNALWASLATGKLPYRHGVTGRFSYRTPLNGADPSERFLLLPSGVGFRAWGLIPPVQRSSAQLPAGDAMPLWSMFERVSFGAAVINWPSATAGAATTVVTDKQIESAASANDVAGVAQRFNGTGPTRTRILAALAKDQRAMAAIRESAQQRSVELDIAWLEGFAEAQRALHIYSNELPARTTVKGEAVRAYVEQIDRMLADLARAFPDHLLVVVSPSGPAPPALADTPYSIIRDAITAEDPGADDGFVLIEGSGIAHRENPSSAYVVDLVPTVLFAAGLPVAVDMDGRVLSEAFDEDFLRRSPLSAIQTYEAKEVIVRRSGKM
ncbi:MAG: alkaline phosphatase family protein [Thermoanaerobaculia bacterium]